jgi:hypothetical protein
VKLSYAFATVLEIIGCVAKYGFQVDCSRCDIAERPVNKGFQIKQIGVVLFE